MEKSKNNILKIVAIILAVAIVVAGVVIGLKYKDKFTSGSVAEVTTTEDTIEELTTEEPTTEFDTSVYDGILNEYRSAKKGYDEYPEDRKYEFEYNYSLCNDPMVLSADFSYAYADIDGDSVKELLVGVSESEDESDVSIVNVWKIRDGEVKPLFANKAYGYRMSIDVCENGLLLEWMHDGGYSSYYNFYDLKSDSDEPAFIEAVHNPYSFIDEVYSYVKYNTVYDGIYENEDYTEITKEEYDSIMAKYVPITDFDWNAL